MIPLAPPSSSSVVTSSVPRLFRSLELAKPWMIMAAGKNQHQQQQQHQPTSSNTKFSPRELLSTLTVPSLTVKQQPRRCFMYEEHGSSKLMTDDNFDGPTKVLQLSPLELAELLHGKTNATTSSSKNDGQKEQYYYYYWTSPIQDVAPQLLGQLFVGYENLHPPNKQRYLDPRGPSLWMGSCHSATQAHYDVADNVIVQLFGHKRIRCYSPTCAMQLHVFPDAHARARKAQVNFDLLDHHDVITRTTDDNKHNNANDNNSSQQQQHLQRFPHFATLPPPVLDCVLEPGDALSIPAFWFHHVENYNPNNYHHSSANGDVAAPTTTEEPSVSLNLFALSESMLVAQEIFQRASRPFAGNGHSLQDTNDNIHTVAVLLRALAWELCSKLESNIEPRTLIRTFLLDTRYGPLRCCPRQRPPQGRKQQPPSSSSTTTLQPEQAKRTVKRCIQRIVPQLEWLANNADDGVVSLVICHLLELWAVEMVGANSVEAAWEVVLLLPES